MIFFTIPNILLSYISSIFFYSPFIIPYILSHFINVSNWTHLFHTLHYSQTQHSPQLVFCVLDTYEFTLLSNCAGLGSFVIVFCIPTNLHYSQITCSDKIHIILFLHIQIYTTLKRVHIKTSIYLCFRYLRFHTTSRP